MPRDASIVRSTWVIASLTAASRVLGLAREITLAYFFSTSGLLSAFRIAFMIPNLARRLFGEGALSAAMIPVLTETLQTEGEQASKRFAGRLLGAVLVLLSLGVVIVEVALWGWRRWSTDPALDFAALLMPYMVMICVVALMGGMLNVRDRFAVPAVMPVFLNTGIIAAAWLGARLNGDSTAIHIRYICYGVVVAGMVQLLVSGLALRREGFAPKLGLSFRDDRIRRVARLMGPMVLGLSAVQINSLADYMIAYFFISDGGERVGPAVLGYAQYLYQLPLGVFGIALATAIFPELARRSAAVDRAGMVRVMTRGVRLSLFIALPASVGLMFVAHPLVEALYQRGNFDAGDTRRVASTLFFYAIGMVGYFAQHILVRTFYAMHDSRTPARVALTMVIVNVALNLSLVQALEERGLALATALCAILQATWLAILLARRLDGVDWREMKDGVVRIAAATGVMAVVLGLLNHPGIRAVFIPERAMWETTLLVVIGIGSYAAASRALRIPEFRMLISTRGGGI